MATQTQYASSVVSATLYTNGSNCYSSNDSYGTWTSTTRNATAQLVLGIAAFSIPTGATINSVTLYMEHKWSSGASSSIDYCRLQIAYGATLRGTQWSDSGFPTSDTTVNTAGGTWTVSELNDGTMRAYIDSDRKNTTTSTTHSIDVVYVVVDYTPAAVNITIDCDTADAVGILTASGIAPSAITVTASQSITATAGDSTVSGMAATTTIVPTFTLAGQQVGDTVSLTWS